MGNGKGHVNTQPVRVKCYLYRDSKKVKVRLKTAHRTLPKLESSTDINKNAVE